MICLNSALQLLITSRHLNVHCLTRIGIRRVCIFGTKNVSCVSKTALELCGTLQALAIKSLKSKQETYFSALNSKEKAELNWKPGTQRSSWGKAVTKLLMILCHWSEVIVSEYENAASALWAREADTADHWWTCKWLQMLQALNKTCILLYIIFGIGLSAMHNPMYLAQSNGVLAPCTEKKVVKRSKRRVQCQSFVDNVLEHPLHYGGRPSLDQRFFWEGDHGPILGSFPLRASWHKQRCSPLGRESLLCSSYTLHEP